MWIPIIWCDKTKTLVSILPPHALDRFTHILYPELNPYSQQPKPKRELSIGERIQRNKETRECGRRIQAINAEMCKFEKGPTRDKLRAKLDAELVRLEEIKKAYE